MAHAYYLNAARRNIRETTASAGRCRFMRRLPRFGDKLDLIVCAVIVALVIIYEVTP